MYNAKPGRPSRTYLRRVSGSQRPPSSPPPQNLQSLPCKGRCRRRRRRGCRTAPHQYPPGSPHTLPCHISAQGPMLCIGPPPDLAANCRLPVAARSRPQCRAGVHARRSALASPHRAGTAPNLPCAGASASQRPPSSPPPQTTKASPARGGAAAGGGGVPHLALPIPFRLAAHRSPATYLHRARCFASPRRQTSRQTVAYPSVPVPGHNVGRAFTPAAAPLRHHTPPQTSKASPARGGCRRRRRRGAAPRPANTLPGRSIPPSSHPLYRPPTLCHLPPPSPPQNKNRGPAFCRTAISACLFPLSPPPRPAWVAAVYRVTPRRPAPAG